LSERNICSNFNNCTTNRLESYHQKLKYVLEGTKTLVEIMKSVLLLSSAKELMNDQLGFLQKVSRYYNMNSTDCSDVQELYDVLTPYAAKQAEVELKKALCASSVASEGRNYVVSQGPTLRVVNQRATSCSCSFKASTLQIACHASIF